MRKTTKVSVGTGGTSHVKIVSGGRSGGIGISQAVQATPEYGGPYVVTPGDSAKILNTSGKKMTGNVVVQGVPSNYGKISWNGSTLTVS